MGRINIEIDDELHDDLREKSGDTSVPIKYLIIKALEDEYGGYSDTETQETPLENEDGSPENIAADD